VRRELLDGYELDDDRARVDVDAVHDHLCNESYWAEGRARETVEQLVREASRVVGLYHGERQVGFAGVVSDNVVFAYLADVYVLEEARGRSLGMELVREAVDNGPHRDLRWMLGTMDAHDLYARLGFGAPSWLVMERPPARGEQRFEKPPGFEPPGPGRPPA
jgi:GNAT superfamily N-acetyltransferase